MTFLGAAWLLRRGGHIRIDTIVIRLDPKTREILDIIVTTLGCVVCAIIVWFGTQKTFDLYQRGIMDVKGVTLPKFPLFLIIPLGGFMLLVQFIRNLFTHLKALMRREDK
jgi:TRAP-type C4-dicarboxylate transport system permease small subunit